MSISRSTFNCDIPMGNYREELLKSKETLMANHSAPHILRTPNCKLLKNAPNSPRIFQFGSGGGNGGNGDFLKFKSNFEKFEKIKEEELMDCNSSISNFKRTNNIQKYPISNELGFSNSQYIRTGRGNQRSAVDFKKIYMETEPKITQKDSDDSFLMSMKHAKGRTLENDLGSEHPWLNTMNALQLKHDDEPNIPLNTSASATSIVCIEMNYIVLCGLFLGVTVSKLVQLLYRYFCWFLEHVLHMRNLILGSHNLADIFNIEDNSHFSLRNKILLLPLISIVCLIYSLITVFNGFLNVLLSQAPKGLIKVMRKWHGN